MNNPGDVQDLLRCAAVRLATIAMGVDVPLKNWTFKSKKETKPTQPADLAPGARPWEELISDAGTCRVLCERMKVRREATLDQLGVSRLLRTVIARDFSTQIWALFDQFDGHLFHDDDSMYDLAWTTKEPYWPLLDDHDTRFWVKGDAVYTNNRGQMVLADWSDVWRWALMFLRTWADLERDEDVDSPHVVDGELVVAPSVALFVDSCGPQIEPWIGWCLLGFQERERTPHPAVPQGYGC